jgi:hypothetical protein
MAEVFYHGIGHSGDKRRYNELKSDLLSAQNERIRTLTISKTKLIGELDGAGAQIERLIGESELSPREKKAVMAIWERTKRAALSAGCEWNKLLREARKAGPGAKKSNGA